MKNSWHWCWQSMLQPVKGELVVIFKMYDSVVIFSVLLLLVLESYCDPFIYLSFIKRHLIYLPSMLIPLSSPHSVPIPNSIILHTGICAEGAVLRGKTKVAWSSNIVYYHGFLLPWDTWMRKFLNLILNGQEKWSCNDKWSWF